MKLDGSQLWQELERIREETIPVLGEYQRINPDFDAAKIIGDINAVLERQSRTFKLGIVGEFKSGKSSLINALAEAEMALVDELETTASLNMYGYADRESATIIYNDGRTDEMTPAQANALLDNRRFDVDWLQQIKTVEMRGPSQTLKRLELWDTPGLGGAQFNANLARRFLREVDAVVWVFDCNYLGKASLNETLQELRDRGKHIIGVVNKCEERTEEELSRVNTLVERSYSSIHFQKIIPFSALMAQEFRSGVPESSFLGDLPPDGGLNDLRQVLETEILSDPTQISAAAAAGDLRALVSSASDQAHRVRLAARRTLWLLDDHIKKVDQELEVAISRLTEEFTDELSTEVRDSVVRSINRRLDGADISQLKSQEWLRDQMNMAMQGDASSLDRFFRCRENRVLAAIQQMISDRTNDLYQSLVPQEIAAYFTDIDLNEVNLLSNEDNFHGLSWQATLGWGTAAAVFATLLPPAWLFLAIGGAAALLSRFAASQSSVSFSAEAMEEHENKLRESQKRLCRNAIFTAIDQQRPKLKGAVEQVLAKVKGNIHSIVNSRGEEQILRGTTRAALEQSGSTGEKIAERLNHISSDLARAAGLASETKAALLRAPAVIPQGDQDRAQEFFRAVMAEGADRLEITDGRLDSRALTSFLGVGTSASLRIVAWEQPLSSAAAEAFSQSLHKVEEGRQGSVSVVCPKPIIDQKSDERPSNCWFFTLGGSYEFSGTLSELLSANREITFTPHDDAGELKEKQFQRWWDDNVAGYQTIRIT